MAGSIATGRTVVLAVFSVILSSPCWGQTRAADSVPHASPSEILVLVRPETRTFRGGSMSPLSASGFLDFVRERRVLARTVRPVAGGRSASAAFPGGAWVVELEPGEDPESVAGRLTGSPEILYAGPNHVWRLRESPAPAPVLPSSSTPAATPDDPLFSQQYALTSSRVPEAWGVSLGDGMLVAIIDTGVETGHPDLLGQIAVNAVEAAGSPGIDDDGNGYIDDILGYDFTDVPGLPGVGDHLVRDPDPSDDVGHGTQVAGVVAATRNNGIGIAGVAPGAKLLAVRAGFRTSIPFISALLQEDDVAAAILYAVDRGADILSLSFGDVVDAPVIGHAIRYAQTRGVLVVASAGNIPRDTFFSPASLPAVVSIGASSREEVRTGFSTFGQDLDLLAPGLDVLTTTLGGTYGTVSGTSFSAPMTAGTAALIWSRHPEWTAEEVAWRLRFSSRGTGVWNPERGWGLLDAANGVAAVPAPPVVQVETIDHLDDSSVAFLGTVLHPDLLTWTLSVAREADAVDAGGLATVFQEHVLVEGSTVQRHSEPLGEFLPLGTDTGRWVVRLQVRIRGREMIEERTRFDLASPVLAANKLRMEPQVGNGGWDLVADWSSTELHQGAVRFAGGGLSTRLVEEVTVGSHHGIRIPGPLPPGTWPVQILARSNPQDSYTVLKDTTITIPVTQDIWRSSVFPGVSPGVPMPRSVDWDLDNAIEVLVENPPGANPYGEVKWFEVTGTGVLPLGSSVGLFTGIPVDARDADGDGGPELIVFRVDGWSIWEAPGPGVFPDTQIHGSVETGTVPLGFVDTGSEWVLLEVAGNSLRAYRSDPSTGYVQVSEVPSGVGNLAPEFAAGDMDRDGTVEVAVPAVSGGLVVFEVTPGGVTRQEILDPGGAVVTRLASLTQFGATDLFTLERDPENLAFEGDLDRAAVRLRRWQGDGATLTPVAALALAGTFRQDELQLLSASNQLFLRRGNRFDVVGASGTGLEWLGQPFDSVLPGVDGAMMGVLGDTGLPLVWAGSLADIPGEAVALTPLAAAAVGSEIRVTAVRPVPGAIVVDLTWEMDACSFLGGLDRSGDQRGSYPLGVSPGSATDTVGLGEQVFYVLRTAGCPERNLALRGRTLPPLLLEWAGDQELVLNLDTPLQSDGGSIRLPRAVRLSWNGMLESPEAFGVDREGLRLWFKVPPGPPPDRLILSGVWYEDGMPLGGSIQPSLAVPPVPEKLPSPVLADVQYQNAASGPSLEVVLGGGLVPCDGTLELSPPGLAFPVLAWSTGTAVLPLTTRLSPGRYTLRLSGPCLDPEASELERSFSVGILVYPNPLVSGNVLTIENLIPGSLIEMHDVAGTIHLTTRVQGRVYREPIDSLAPGLYFLRIEAPDNRGLHIQKLAIIR